MKNPQDMTPMEMRAFMREQGNVASNELHFRNRDGEVIFAVIYVESKELCADVLKAVNVVTNAHGTENTERIVG